MQFLNIWQARQLNCQIIPTSVDWTLQISMWVAAVDCLAPNWVIAKEVCIVRKWNRSHAAFYILSLKVECHHFCHVLLVHMATPAMLEGPGKDANMRKWASLSMILKVRYQILRVHRVIGKDSAMRNRNEQWTSKYSHTHWIQNLILNLIMKNYLWII
jgi:hypothetical protein